jgi:hypothetical protein
VLKCAALMSLLEKTVFLLLRINGKISDFRFQILAILNLKRLAKCTFCKAF